MIALTSWLPEGKFDAFIERVGIGNVLFLIASDIWVEILRLQAQEGIDFSELNIRKVEYLNAGEIFVLDNRIPVLNLCLDLHL